MLFWATCISAALHLILLTLIFYAFRAILRPQGAREQVSETTTISIQQRAQPQPKRASHARAREARLPERSPTRHELAHQAPAAKAQPPPRKHDTVESAIARDRTSFADEVAQLNKGNDPHAIPTIDPATAASSSKSYAFDAHSTDGDNGNGIISPVKSWQEGGRDCYYARYSFTYPSGAMEDGNIVWPICFDPKSDPFHEPPHPMPFPPPLAGYVLPPGTQLPPLEKSVYEEWAANASR